MRLEGHAVPGLGKGKPSQAKKHHGAFYGLREPFGLWQLVTEALFILCYKNSLVWHWPPLGMAWHGDGAGKGISLKGAVGGSPDDKPTKTEGPSGLQLPKETHEPHPCDGQVLAQQMPPDMSGTAVTSGESAWSISTSAGRGTGWATGSIHPNPGLVHA